MKKRQRLHVASIKKKNAVSKEAARGVEIAKPVAQQSTAQSDNNATTVSSIVRDCSQLFMPCATWQCALNGSNVSNGNEDASEAALAKLSCIPCAYKVGCFDVALDQEMTRLVPNQRPEACPRIAAAAKGGENIHDDQNLHRDDMDGSCLGYSPGMDVLTVGDGDLSFSLALARLLVTNSEGDDDGNSTPKKISRVVATSYESKETLLRVYPNFETILNEMNEISNNPLNNVQVEIHYQVDATRLSEYDFIMGSCFDRIVWNFPCSAISNGQDGQNAEMEQNKSLVAGFVEEAEPLLTKPSSSSGGGQIHMNHKTKPPFDQWKIEEAAMQNISDQNATNTLSYWGRVVWDRALFPPHIPRKALDAKSFANHDACTFIFTRNQGDNGLLVVHDCDSAMNDNESDDRLGLVPVTKERIGLLRAKLLQQVQVRKLLKETKRKKRKRQF